MSSLFDASCRRPPCLDHTERLKNQFKQLRIHFRFDSTALGCRCLCFPSPIACVLINFFVCLYGSYDQEVTALVGYGRWILTPPA